MLNCRSCNSAQITSIIPLGKLPLANALLSTQHNQAEARYNLEVMLCEACGLAQLRDLIDPVELFANNYVYFSSNSDTMLKSVAELVDRVIPTLPENPFVIEIASNDGYLLKNYMKNNIKVLGIDPAKNIAKIANEQGIPTLCDFFGVSLAQKLSEDGKMADIIHANNVLAHVPDISGFMKGIKSLLTPKGRAIIEVPHFLDLVQKLEFDTIYHEHVFYFSVKALKIAFENQGLEIFDIEKISIHGGTLRLFVGHRGAYDIDSRVEEMIQLEEKNNLFDLATYSSFMDKLHQLKNALRHTLDTLINSKAKIAAYGASAKGTTLLNYFNIGRDYLSFVVDRSTVKQGLFTPGTLLEIKHPDALLKGDISHALLLAWNFAEEIMHQQQLFIDKGGKFILPLPTVQVLS